MSEVGTMTESERLGRYAYHAYGEAVGFKNYQGLPMPTWESLTEEIRGAWKSAAVRLAAEVTFGNQKKLCCGGGCE